MNSNLIQDLSSITFNFSTNTPSTITRNEPVKMPKKCQHGDCKYKLTLIDTSISCKCKKYFCSKHRYFRDHSCEVDYKLDATKNLEKQLVKVAGDKLSEKI